MVEKQACKTYFCIDFEFDHARNAELLRQRPDCTPEEIGIVNKAEVEKYVVDNLGVTPVWERHHFVIGCNEEYNVDVNAMLRITLRDLLGKEEMIKEMQRRLGVETVLQIVPYMAAGGDEPNQCLSLDKEIIGFLYKSNTALDIDYYIVQ